MAAQELFKVVFVSGGSMELGSASNKLSSSSKHEISRKYGKISAMVSQFSEYFTLTKEGRTRHLVEVRLPSSMEFCREAGKKTGCQDGNCPDLHLCTHFLLGACTYGEKCRKSHSVGDVHTRRILCRAGLEFLLENAARLESLLRRKARESEIETTAVNRDAPETCKHYNHQSGCSKGDDCSFLHVCSHYVDGDCKFNGSCNRAHTFRDPHSMKVLKAFGYDRLSDDRILRILRGLKPDRPVQPVSVGSSSKLAHHYPGFSKSMSNLNLSGPVVNHDNPETCKHYNHQSGCMKGDDCSFLHICSHYVDGDCKFNKSCRRAHNFSDPHSKKVLKVFGYDRLSGDQILRILRGLKPDRVRTVSVGTSPSFVQPAHGPNLSRSMSNLSLSSTSSKDEPDICGFHLRGKCNYGDHCKNCHAELPYLWEYRRQGASSWEAASDDLNVMIEEAFCEVTKDSFSVTLGKNQCSIVFDDMIAKPRRGETRNNSQTLIV